MQAGAKKKKVTKYIFMVWILLDICFGFLLVHYQGAIGLRILIRINLGILGISILYDIIYLWKTGTLKYYWQRLVKFHALIIIVLMVIIIAICIHYIFKSDIPLTEGEILSFYGSLMAFIGTFGLGYFIFIKGEEHRREEKISKCKMLASSIDKAENDMSLVTYDDVKLKRIHYDDNWQEYYYEFESVYGKHDDDLKNKLDDYFSIVERMNDVLQAGNYEGAINFNKCYRENDNYSISKYNLSEVKMIIHDIAYFGDRLEKIDFTPWLEKSETKKIIEEYSDKYFFDVENYIYKYLKENGIDCTTEKDNLDRKITDWLLHKSELKEIAKWPPDKRIVSMILVNIALRLNEKSRRVSRHWDMYSIKTD